MISSNNQYLRPEYLTPLPTTLDAKKSPLALLAQTCSQIGADPSSTTSTSKLLQSDKKSSKLKSESPVSKSTSSSSTSSTASFKPYESCTNNREKSKTPEVRVRTPSTKRCNSNQSGSASPVNTTKTDESNNKVVDEAERAPSSKSDSPIKPSPPTSEAGGFKPLPPYLGYPHPGLPYYGLNPYLTYAKSPMVCRDPYCTGCALSPKTAQACPAGCTQCDHQKTFLPAAYAHAQLAALAAAAHLPYVCSWISGDAQYCGKRFSSSEELLTHLRTHTSVSSDLPAGFNPLLHRTYPTPPLSPRYHPYSKPSLLPPSGLSYPPLGAHPGIPPYLAPYSLYGPRLGVPHP